MIKKQTKKHKYQDTAVPSKVCPSCGQRFHRDSRCTHAYWAKAKYCSRECFGTAHAEHAKKKRRPLREEFQKHFTKSDDCWEWTWIKDKDGYALFPYAGKQYRAARLALELDGRPAGAGMLACHTCDNPACVRPDHLYPGTSLQNSNDAIRRKRTIRGERCHNAKLNENDIRCIRASQLSNSALAKMFNVNRSNISMIKTKTTWRHIK